MNNRKIVTSFNVNEMKSNLIKANYQSLIFEFRGYNVMIDFDLAALYGVETKRLKEQVRRNLNRFPKDFMFELTKEEYQPLRSQIATLKRGGHSKYPHLLLQSKV